MEKTIQELHQIINEFSKKFSSFTDDEFSAKPLPHKWSKKEVVGHLIDSAQNNLRRFICGQYETTPPKIVYQQDFWVTAIGYQQAKKEDIIKLWKLLNERICDTLRNMPEANQRKHADTGKDSPELHTLEWLAVDYVKHIKHHINQVLPKSFDVTYP